MVLLMLAVGGLGALMSSTAVVAIFIPVALRIAQTTGTAPGRLMTPLSVAALISGMPWSRPRRTWWSTPS
jgi:di/tricarboxylate transporter